MDTGHLNIPKHEMDDVASVRDVQRKLYSQYSRLTESKELGAPILKAIQDDPRVRALEGHMIAHGRGATRFEPRVLAMWFLWAISEYGNEIAERNLNRFLDSETIPVTDVLWILGIEVRKTIELGSGVRIVPIQEMPDYRDKEQYLQLDLAPPIPKPKAAITRICNVRKVHVANDPARDEEGCNELRLRCSRETGPVCVRV